MPNFKYHLVTVIGIFLALALGIFIGSTFTEESIILQQRNTIESMRDSLDSIAGEKAQLQSERAVLGDTLSLGQSWLAVLSELYFEANPIQQRVALLYASDFDPVTLGSYFNETVIHARLQLDDLDSEAATVLVQALTQGDARLLTEQLGYELEGEFEQLDGVFIAPGDPGWPEVETLAVGLLNAELPVVGLGPGDWEGAADLARHPLFASVSHLDTPLALYCLDAILRGQRGHYGTNILLPRPIWP